jgi:hypothetical protein
MPPICISSCCGRRIAAALFRTGSYSTKAGAGAGAYGSNVRVVRLMPCRVLDVGNAVMARLGGVGWLRRRLCCCQ